MTYDCQALHGDITQANRESTLDGFKKGSFKVRGPYDVATAMREIYITGVTGSAEPAAIEAAHVLDFDDEGGPAVENHSRAVFTPPVFTFPRARFFSVP